MHHPAIQVNSFKTSQFCQRLHRLATANGSTTTLQNLRTATERLVSHAQAISDQIVRHLPQFTLHNGTHLWNVLSFMEELAGGKESIDKLGAGDCAMAVWAAFTHDLGMVLEACELAALDAADHFDTSPDVQDKPATWGDQRVQDWRAYRDGHEHWSAIRQEPHSEKSRMKLGIIRAAFIRDSHARQDAHSGHCRIADWLAFIADTDRVIKQALEDYSFDERIVRVAVSHNQDIAWLPRQLSAFACSDPHAEHDAELDTIHWTWIGWLLRLADVFDCDASRTPRILFDYGGIEDPRSRTEWQKHLAIRNPPTWGAGHDSNTLLYTCHLSPSPVVEKAIHQIIGWMNDEIVKCRAAWNALSETQRRDLTLALPSEAKPDIKKRTGDYLYQDIEFRLDRDAVVELLMGESLYGGPELALRELVQNALDAVHLRDQRNKLAIALEKAGSKEKARQHHQPWGAKGGQVEVTWGTEPDGQKRSWIKVQDNGVGMTVATMRRFLTQIGKSYYKSDDFHAEQELMRRHGILCTAISQFGIGFLSVFMLADHVEIHTRPVGATDHPDKTKPNWQETESFPFRADIHGPHGLLAFYPDDVRQTGTTVTLWLKEKFMLAEWDRELVIDQLKEEFYGTELSKERRDQIEAASNQRLPNGPYIDPAFEVGRVFVWPLYPVRLVGKPCGAPLAIDDSFHFAELQPIDTHRLEAIASLWGISSPELTAIGWQICDWTDVHLAASGFTGSGTRIRVVGPREGAFLRQSESPESFGLHPELLQSGLSRSLLSSFVAPQLVSPKSRHQCLINGVRVIPGLIPSDSSKDLQRVTEQLPFAPGIGGWVWIDLRGEAMPRLRADRSAPVANSFQSQYLSGVAQRWVAAWPLHSLNWLPTVIFSKFFGPAISVAECPKHRLGVNSISAEFIVSHLLAESYWSLSLSRFLFWPSLPREPEGAWERDAIICRATTLLATYIRPVELFTPHEHESKHYVGRQTAILSGGTTKELVRSLNIGINMHLDAEIHANSFSFDESENSSWLDTSVHRDLLQFRNQHPDWSNRSELFIALHDAYLASEALWPSFELSHPALGLRGLSGCLNDYHLCGPMHIARDGNAAMTIEWMEPYDLVAPFTAFASDQLRSLFPAWMRERGWRALYTLPFVIGRQPLEWQPFVDSSERSNFRKLMLFMPNPDHYEWLFAEHTKEEWSLGSASALWDLTTGQVLYADGIHTEASLRAEGKPLREWLGIK